DRAEAVGAQVARGEVHTPLYAGSLVQSDLLVELSGILPGARFADAVVRLSDVELYLGALGERGPPLEQHRIVGGPEPDVAVELRHDVVDPTLLDPFAGVGVDGVVGLQSAGLRTARIGIGVAPDAERADAELHPRLDRLDALVHLLHQQVDVVA